MHETAIVHELITEAKKHGDVQRISLEIGELAHCPGEEIIECFKRLVPWKISWKEIPARVKCACGFVGHPSILSRGHDHFMIECPKCKKVPELKTGTQIIIKDVVVS